jgi:hypothetical protein
VVTAASSSSEVVVVRVVVAVDGVVTVVSATVVVEEAEESASPGVQSLTDRADGSSSGVMRDESANTTLPGPRSSFKAYHTPSSLRPMI